MREELKRRDLPALRSREEMREVMQREVYGYLPQVDYTLSYDSPVSVERRYMCGRVEHSFVNLTVKVEERVHTFRVDRLLHVDGKKRPLVIFQNFAPISSSPYFPIEEMSEYEVDFLAFCYQDITTDNADFSNGLAVLLLPNGQERKDSCGKIAVWAWAAMRVLDYGLTLEGTDPNNIAIAGHSRLGKTAAFTAMMDERFRFAFSNAAGCTGDALSHGNSGHGKKHDPALRHQRGELISDITHKFPYWFCKNYLQYAEHDLSDCFDQHYLLASIAPRYVMVGACSEDAWADPVSQQLCALAAGEAWEQAGKLGLVDCDRLLEPGEGSIDGHVGFFKIYAKHFLSRHSWRWFIRFIEAHQDDPV